MRGSGGMLLQTYAQALLSTTAAGPSHRRRFRLPALFAHAHRAQQHSVDAARGWGISCHAQCVRRCVGGSGGGGMLAKLQHAAPSLLLLELIAAGCEREGWCVHTLLTAALAMPLPGCRHNSLTRCSGWRLPRHLEGVCKWSQVRCSASPTPAPASIGTLHTNRAIDERFRHSSLLWAHTSCSSCTSCTPILVFHPHHHPHRR